MKIQYVDGTIYEGEVNNAMMREGYGTLIFFDGAYYEGMWKDNRMNGKGTLFDNNN